MPPVCLQERPEDVPTGELPRNMQLIVDRHLVGQIAPGTRVTVYGIYSVYQVTMQPVLIVVHRCKAVAVPAPLMDFAIGTGVTGPHMLAGLQNSNKSQDKAGVAIRMPYIRVVGLEEEFEGAHSTPVFS